MARLLGWHAFPAKAATRVAAGVLLVALVTGATAFAATSLVVPVRGRVAGKGYAYWLRRGWQFQFAQTAPHPCVTMVVNARKVGYLWVNAVPPSGLSGTTRFTCNEPAGRPIYIVEYSWECSTFPGDHGEQYPYHPFGTSDTQLRLCAQWYFNAAADPRQSTKIDGHLVNVSKLVAATDVFPVHDPSGTHTGRSAAYGSGLLLRGLKRGTHVIHSVVDSFGGEYPNQWVGTWTIHVH